LFLPVPYNDVSQRLLIKANFSKRLTLHLVAVLVGGISIDDTDEGGSCHYFKGEHGRSYLSINYN